MPRSSCGNEDINARTRKHLFSTVNFIFFGVVFMSQLYKRKTSITGLEKHSFVCKLNWWVPFSKILLIAVLKINFLKQTLIGITFNCTLTCTIENFYSWHFSSTDFYFNSTFSPIHYPLCIYLPNFVTCPFSIINMQSTLTGHIRSILCVSMLEWKSIFISNADDDTMDINLGVKK